MGRRDGSCRCRDARSADPSGEDRAVQVGGLDECRSCQNKVAGNSITIGARVCRSVMRRTSLTLLLLLLLMLRVAAAAI